MKNVDRIIRYLSGDLSPDEMGLFEKELNSNTELLGEYEQISEAYALISDQIQQRDEAAFRTRLLEVMNKKKTPQRDHIFRWRITLRLLIPLAASVALVITLFVIEGRSDDIFSQYYDPQNDPVILAYSQGTRNSSIAWIKMYKDGHYCEAADALQTVMEQEPENQVAVLFFLLASIETDQEESALRVIDVKSLNLNHQLGRSVSWYWSLALIKADQADLAANQIKSLAELPGIYNSNAKKLRRRMLK